MPNSLHNRRQAILEETNPAEYQQSYHLIYDEDYILDARWHGNAFRHLNHSCEPNCAAIKRHAYGVQVILITSIRHIAAGEECTLHYGSLKPTPCNCLPCYSMRSSSHTPSSSAHNEHPPITTDLTSDCMNISDDDESGSPNHSPSTQHTNTTASHTTTPECSASSSSVNKKRTKYPLSFLPSPCRALLITIGLLLHHLPQFSLQSTKHIRWPNRTHPSHRFTTPSFTGCITGDGPPPLPSTLNPCAATFTPSLHRNTIASGRPNPHARHSSRPHTHTPRRTPAIAPTTTAPPHIITPNTSTHAMWNHITPTLDNSTIAQFSDTFHTHLLTTNCNDNTPPDLRVAYLNIRTLTPDKHFFISAFIYRYRIDVLFLTDTRVANTDCSKHMLRTCLGKDYTILHSPPIAHSPGGQTIIIAPSWSGAFQTLWCDPSTLGLLTEVTLRSGQQNVKLFGAY